MFSILRGQIAIEVGFKFTTWHDLFDGGGEAALKRGAQAVNATALADVVGQQGARLTVEDAPQKGSKQERPPDGRRRACRAN